MIELPENIRKLVNITDSRTEDIGKSGASVLMFRDKVLKIEERGEEAEHEIQVMEWLDGKLPVPKVIYQEKQDGMQYFLMSKVPGEMSCSEGYLQAAEKLVNILAEGLQMLWKVDLADCPFTCGLDQKLRMAAYNVEHGLVDVEDTQPETFGENGFESPQKLLDWLAQNRPEEDLVFSHGDFCLPNIFIQNGKISGFIDLGQAGAADRYQDIALCYRSLQNNLAGKYGGRAYESVRPELLFEKLGLKPDWEKIKYYILLDELF